MSQYILIYFDQDDVEHVRVYDSIAECEEALSYEEGCLWQIYEANCIQEGET